MMEELGAAASEGKVDDLLRQILERTGYARMLQADNDPEAESRLGNLNELVNAASEAAERGETIAEFLDHAALVSDSDGLDERAPVSLLTLHNAKGLEFPIVFLAGNGRGSLPARSLARFESRHGRGAAPVLRRHDALREAAVPDFGALSTALWRRPAGSHHPVAIPARSSKGAGGRSWPVATERSAPAGRARELSRPNLYTGKTYNSVDNIHSSSRSAAKLLLFRNGPANRQSASSPTPKPAVPPQAARPPAGRRGFRAGAMIRHPKYGRGTVLRREGDGEDAKLTVSFPGYGLKKLVEKYAGIQED